MASVSREDSTLEALRKEIEELKLKVDNLVSVNRSGSTADSRSISNSCVKNKPNFCWYHNRFGEKARDCIKPCSDSENL